MATAKQWKLVKLFQWERFPSFHMNQKGYPVKLYQCEVMSDALVDAEVITVTPVIVDACFAALCAKLRAIHKQVQTYANQFQPPPTYTRDNELPLPLTDVILNIGVFTPSGIVQNYLCIRVYPENILNEGRSARFGKLIAMKRTFHS